MLPGGSYIVDIDCTIWCNRAVLHTPLQAYLRKLTIAERDWLAGRCETTLGHLNNLAYGRSQCSPALAARLEAASKGEITRLEIQPKDWQILWPELAQLVERREAA